MKKKDEAVRCADCAHSTKMGIHTCRCKVYGIGKVKNAIRRCDKFELWTNQIKKP